MRKTRKFRIEKLEQRHLLATFVVNTFADSKAVNFATGQDANGKISLRSAIMAANSLATTDKIVLSPYQSENPDSIYRLTIVGRNENQAATGDLDIKGPLTIEGNGALIDAQAIDRVFEILAGSKVTLQNLSLEHGEAAEGGAIYNASRLTLSSVNVSGTATAPAPIQVKGGAIYNGKLGVINSIASQIVGVAQGGGGSNGSSLAGSNGSPGGDAMGGAIYNLGKITASGAGVFGEAFAGRGGDGAAGTSGRDSSGTIGPTSGRRGTNGGDGGDALGGAVYNGVAATFQYDGADVGSLQGEAIAGIGGNGREGGKGGDAGIWHFQGASGLFSPGIAAPGGNGGNAGDSYGGAIYNELGSVSLSTSHQNSQNSFRIRAKALAFAGGSGGDGGQGGAGASDGPNGARVSSGNGSGGGNGGNGGSVFGGAIFSTGGSIQLNRVLIGATGNPGAFAGQNGSGGSGGSAGIPADALSNGVEGVAGSDGAAGLAEGGAFRILGGTFGLSNSRVEGVTVAGGDGRAKSAWGGAFNISNGSVTIQDSVLSNNSAKGGRLFSPSLHANGGAVIIGTDAGPSGGAAFGGAIWISSGSLNILHSTLDHNTVNGKSGTSGPLTSGISVGDSIGAGIGMIGGSVIVDRSTISNGNAFGASAIRPAVPGIGSTQRGANGGSAYGGGIYATGGALSISNSTISGNRVLSTAGTEGQFASPGNGGNAHGAGLYLTNAVVNITNATIYGNTADMKPSGLGNNTGAARGGGIYHAGSGKVTLNHLTIAANKSGSAIGTSDAGGGGIFNGSGTIEIQNSIVAQNFVGAGQSSQRDIGGIIISLGFNLVGVRNGTTNFRSIGDRAGTHIRPLNVGVGSLSNNGGPTLTCSLLASSIARDAANPSDSTTTDQRGITRPFNGRSDIGAFEFII